MSEDDKITFIGDKKSKIGFYGKKKKAMIVKEFLGFEYVKLKKDTNGIRFNKKTLKDFSSKIKYTVSIMREIDNNIYLYEYFIDGAKLKDFMHFCFDGKIDGEIIQIEKYTPENLA